MEFISIPYCVLESKTLLSMSATKKHYDLCFPLNIDRLQNEYISIPYCVLEYKALLTILDKKGAYDLCFPLNIDQLQTNSISIFIVYWSLKLFKLFLLKKVL